MEQKIIFLDIDGTLTPAGSNTPPESALKAIKKARENGHLVYLCTGRNYQMLKPVYQLGCFDGLIGSAGGYIVCHENSQDRVIYDCPMTEEARQTALRVLKDSGAFLTVECVDASYTDPGVKEYLRTHAKEGSNSEMLRWREQLENTLDIHSLEEYKDQPIYKIIIMCRSMDQLTQARKELEQDFVFCMQEPDASGFYNGELVNRQFDKGKGVVRICEHLGVPLSASIGFGDSMNDVEMIETVSFGVCMANGSEKLKELADEVCPSVQEDGLYREFEKLGLL